MTKRQIDAINELSDTDEEKPVVKKKQSGIKRQKLNKSDNMGCLSSKNVDEYEDNDKKKLQKSTHRHARKTKDVIKPVVQTANASGNVTHQGKNDSLLLYEWNTADYIQKIHHLNENVAETVVKFFDTDNTIPFIARYRRAQTGGLDADELRVIKQSYDRAAVIKHKANTVIKAIERNGKWTPEIHNAVKSMMTLVELDYIQSLYKVESKKSLAERARELGLGSIAEAVLEGKKVPNLTTLINHNKEGLQDEAKIKHGIVCILADLINKDKRTFDKIKDLREKVVVQIQTKKVLSTAKASNDNKTKKKSDDERKYEMYFEWNMSEQNIKPHHVLAINRAEAEKIITVQISIPNHFEAKLEKDILDIHSSAARTTPFHKMLISEAFHYAFKKSIAPAIIRRTRSELNEKALEASMEVFAVNVKQLLLTQPVRGKIILGIDPGFAHGCKLAVISAQGEVLETKTIYPHRDVGKSRLQDAHVLATLVRKYDVKVMALGNATACRETEVFLSDLIKSGKFAPQEVSYTIVNEAGASIYSCSPEAKTEFPKLDCNVISAVSIARRLQDPLAELVKVDPKHLGVGMYQHDLPEKQLVSKLNEVVMQAVSFVGVDINTASHCLLKRVAGMSDVKATNVINWRKENGCFTSRQQLLKVKGIGPKAFEQCAGFIRIVPETCGNKSAINYLDQTWIHPESYDTANALVKAARLNLKDLGTREFITAVRLFVAEGNDVVAKKLGTTEGTVEVIVNGLTMKKGEDIRNDSKAPLFRNSLRCLADLAVGSLLSGEVRNVVDFGAFVDVGVERDGLIHKSNLAGEILVLGNRVDVKVIDIDKERGRLGLFLIKRY